MDYTLSIGTNIGDKQQLIQQTLTELNKIGTIKAISSAYETKPWGFSSTNSFINIALIISSNLVPVKMLESTQAIERTMGRTTKSQNGYTDRPIDIDIIYAENIILNTQQLTIPHPLMHKRNFVLTPLAEIAPNYIHPILNLTSCQLLTNTPDTDIPSIITDFTLKQYIKTK